MSKTSSIMDPLRAFIVNYIAPLKNAVVSTKAKATKAGSSSFSVQYIRDVEMTLKTLNEITLSRKQLLKQMKEEETIILKDALEQIESMYPKIDSGVSEYDEKLKNILGSLKMKVELAIKDRTEQ